MENKGEKDRFGVIATIISTLFYIIAIIFFVIPLEKKLALFLQSVGYFAPRLLVH